MLGLMAQAAREHAEAQDEEGVPDDGPRQGCLYDFRKPARECEDRDDQLGCIPKRRVQKTADPGTRMFAQLLRGEPEKPSEGHNRNPGNGEHKDLVSKNEIEDPTGRDEQTQKDGPGVRAEWAEVHRARETWDRS